MDLSKLSTEDLIALKNNEISKFSDAGLKLIRDQVAKERLAKSGGMVNYGDPGYDPTEDMSPLQKLGAGAGKAFVDIGKGAGQLIGLVDRKDIDRDKLIDAPLMRSGAGAVGNAIGNVAALAPTALIPGANTVVGGAAIGAGLGAAQPVGTDDSRIANIGIGAVAGGALPALSRAARTVKAAAVDPFTDAGRNRIAGALLNRTADDPMGVLQRLKVAQGSTPGFNPTAAQVADDSGIAALERTVRATAPEAFGAVDKSQRGALVEALRNIAGTPEARTAAIDAREAAVNPLYASAKRATVQGDDELSALLRRPSIQSAAARAERLANERGDQFMLNRPTQGMTIEGTMNPATGVRNVSVIPGQQASYSGQSLHDLKMGLSDAIGSPVMGMQGAERAAALGTEKDYLRWLESKIPEYGQARTIYAEMSKPINQMDIGQELYNRFVPALAESEIPFKTRADALANALRNGDDLARNVTGMKGATLQGTMTPEQMQALQGVVSDAQMVKAAESAGRGVGSDTVQKTAMSHILSESGIPNWASSVMRVPGGWAKRAADLLYGSSDEAVKNRLADILRNPQEAAAAMEAAGISPSRTSQTLLNAGQFFALPSPTIMNSQ